MIDLKQTLDNAKITQAHIASHFDIKKQQVNRWYKGGNITKGWDLLLRQYFNAHDKKVFEIK